MLYNLKSIIKNKAVEFGIHVFGIAPFREYSEITDFLNREIKTQFEAKTDFDRISPVKVFEHGKSIMVAAFSYNNSKTKCKNMSKYSVVQDYHRIVAERLEKFCDLLKNEGIEFNHKILVDINPLPERYLAYLAGVGLFGKNRCLINEDYGSYIVIGCVLTDLELEADKPCEDMFCVGCGKCIAACPGGALTADGKFNPDSCVSYITQLKEITEEQKEILKKSGMVYGCDVCQEVCPHNENARLTDIAEFSVNCCIDTDDFESMSNKEFKEKYGKYAFAWRGKRVLARNTKIIAD